MERMRRHWPFAFLFFLALILAVHVVPPPHSVDRTPGTGSPVPDPDVASPTAAPRISADAPISALEPAAALPDAPTASRSPVLAGLLWSLRHQNEDGSWGDEPTTLGDRTIGKTGVTSLVLLSLLGAGYSHLSKDEYDGIPVGVLIKKGTDWLLAQQREDGTFRSGFDDRFDQALAVLALCESYGMTASMRLKDPTTRAMDALLELQGPDGSWGGGTTTPWAVEALVSGSLSELLVPPSARERALESLRSQAPPARLEALMMFRDRSDPELLEALAQQASHSLPQGGETDFQTIYHQSLGLFQYDGVNGVLWKKWAPAAREALVSTQNADGSWNGGTLSHRLVRTSLAEFTLQIYYRYGNNLVFGH